MKRIFILGAWLGLLLTVSTSSWAQWHNMFSRDLACETHPDARGQEICRLLEKELEWTWFGHAIVSPRWRTTLGTIHRAWCAAKLTEADIPALEALRHSRNFRLESGATGLLALLRPDEADPVSVYHPKHPAYLLRDGCP